MAVITFSKDVVPHLRRQLMYRRLRMQRLQALYELRRDHYDGTPPYSWLETVLTVDFLIMFLVLACIIGFVVLAFVEIGNWAKVGALRLQGLHAAKT
jgi:hypothetical protein